jgi:hypothetical protein
LWPNGNIDSQSGPTVTNVALVLEMRLMTIEAIAAALPTAVTLASATITGLLLVYARRFVQGTTLVAPWRWSIVALAMLVATGVVGSETGMAPGWLAPARFAAAMATFCPLVAVLGAKRPQDRAWQLIVLSFLFVVSLPALADLVYHYGQDISLDAPWRWFIAILIVAGWVNYLPTRYGPSSALYGMAQIALVGEFLPWPLAVRLPESARVAASLALFGLSAGLVAIGWPRRRPAAEPVDRLWRDFRDCYGILWSVRVRERTTGISHGADSLPAREGRALADPEDSRAAPRHQRERVLVAHMRRFVSRAWIESRLAPASGEAIGSCPGTSDREPAMPNK